MKPLRQKGGKVVFITNTKTEIKAGVIDRGNHC